MGPELVQTAGRRRQRGGGVEATIMQELPFGPMNVYVYGDAPVDRKTSASRNGLADHQGLFRKIYGAIHSALRVPKRQPDPRKIELLRQRQIVQLPR